MNRCFIALFVSLVGLVASAAQQTKTNVVCFVRFADEDETVFTNTPEHYATLFNGDGEVNVAGLEQAMNEGRVKVSFALNASTGRPDACLNGEVVETEIRSMEVSSRVSKVAALPISQSSGSAPI